MLSQREISEMVMNFSLNEDAREKLNSIPREVFDIVKKDFRTPPRCDNTSGMLISFVCSVSKRMGNVTPASKVQSIPVAPEKFGGSKIDKEVDEFLGSWRLHPNYASQVRRMTPFTRAFTFKYFRPDSPGATANALFHEFVQDLGELTDSRTYVDEQCQHVCKGARDIELIAGLEDFCTQYHLNEDARHKLESISTKSLETVLQEFVFPEGAVECNGMVINFANGVEKKNQGRGKWARRA